MFARLVPLSLCDFSSPALLSDLCLACRLLTGQVDERTIAKYEREAKEKNRESWYIAYIMDTNEEERAKGKTVEVGRANFATKNKRFTLLDCPGHKNYVRLVILYFCNLLTSA